MGNHSCCARGRPMMGLEEIEKEVIEYLNSSNISGLKKIIADMRKYNFDINTEFIHLGRNCVTVFCYSFLIGNCKAAKILYGSGSDVGLVNNFFSCMNSDLVYFICKKGYVSILDFYLPIFLEKYRKDESDTEKSVQETLNFEYKSKNMGIDRRTPVQKACEKGHISSYIFF